jgi:hypothetical protein
MGGNRRPSHLTKGRGAADRGEWLQTEARYLA